MEQFTKERNAIIDAMGEARPMTPEERVRYNVKPDQIAYVDRKGEPHFPGSGATNVRVGLEPQEKAERSKRGELLARQYEKIYDTAERSRRQLGSIDVQQRILDDGFKTGWGTGAKKAAASVLSALGVPEAEKYATSAQTFLAASREMVNDRMQEQKGTQTENDRKVIEEIYPQLGNTVEANRFILAVARAQANRDIEERKFYDKWWRDKKTYDRASDAWLEGEGSKSLFDRPELKMYKKPAPAGAPAAPAAGGGKPSDDPNRPLNPQEMKEFEERQKYKQQTKGRR